MRTNGSVNRTNLFILLILGQKAVQLHAMRTCTRGGAAIVSSDPRANLALPVKQQIVAGCLVGAVDAETKAHGDFHLRGGGYSILPGRHEEPRADGVQGGGVEHGMAATAADH